MKRRLTRAEIAQIKESMLSKLQVYKGQDTLWHWTAGSNGSLIGFQTKAEASSDFESFIKNDLKAEVGMQSRGKAQFIKMALRPDRPKARGDYPDQVLWWAFDFYDENKKSERACSINAVRFAIAQNLVTQAQADNGLAKAVAADMRTHNRKKATAAIV